MCVLLIDFDELDVFTLDFVVWTTVKVICWRFVDKKKLLFGGASIRKEEIPTRIKKNQEWRPMNEDTEYIKLPKKSAKHMQGCFVIADFLQEYE